MATSQHSRRSGRALSRLLGFLAGLLVFVALLAVLIVWAAGRFAPAILDSALFSRSGCSLSVEDNGSNLLAGRLVFGGLKVDGASRWQERGLLRATEFRADLDPVSLLGSGPRVIRELRLDVDELTVVGKEDYRADNNLRDLLLSFSSGPDAAPAGEDRPFRYRIERLTLKVRRLRVIAGDGTERRRTVVDRDAGLVLEARDVDEANFGEKVMAPLSERLAGLAVRVGVDAAVDLARQKVLRAAESILSPR